MPPSGSYILFLLCFPISLSDTTHTLPSYSADALRADENVTAWMWLHYYRSVLVERCKVWSEHPKGGSETLKGEMSNEGAGCK